MINPTVLLDIELSDGTTVQGYRDEVCDDDEGGDGDWHTLWKLVGEDAWHEWNWSLGKHPIAYTPTKQD